MKKIIATSVGLVLLASSASFAAGLPYDGKASVGGLNGQAYALVLEIFKAKPVAQTVTQSYTPTPSPVPLPAAGWMLLAGVGGLVAMRRRGRA